MAALGSKYRWSGVRKDVLAGLTVAAIAIPQAMAYALIAGIDPRYRSVHRHRHDGRGLRFSARRRT